MEQNTTKRFFALAPASPTLEQGYFPRHIIDDGVPVAEEPTEDTPNADMSGGIPGLVGEIAYYIYGNAHKQNKEVAYSAALALMAGITGRAYNWNGTGLNQYFVLLAYSGHGKEDAEKGINRLLSSLWSCGLVPKQYVEDILGPSHIASAPGLVNKLRETPCFLSIVGEFGKMLERLCSKRASASDVALNSLFLDLYNRSGNGQVLGTSAYSDRTKNGAVVHSPCFSMFGASTQEAFFKAITEQDAAEGTVSRFTVVECADAGYVESNYGPKPEPSQRLLQALSELIIKCQTTTFAPVPVAATDDVQERYIELERTYGKLVADNRDKSYMNAYNRAALITMKTAALLAVGINPYSPVITKQEFEWAEKLTYNSVHAIISRFEAGKVGVANLYVEQHDQLLSCLKDYLKRPWIDKLEKNYGIPEHFKAQRLITYKYIKSMLHKRPAFRNAANPKMAFDNIIKQFEQAEHLLQVGRAHPIRGQSTAQMWFIANLRE